MLLDLFILASENSSWFQNALDTLYDPAWNREHAHIIWPLICIVLAATGVGLPTPEDIWLTLAGFSAWKQGGDQFVWYFFVGVFFMCTFSNMVGDAGAWWLGRRFGFPIRDRFKFMRRILSDKRLKRVQGWFDKYGNWTVFLGRQVAGIRFVTFFSAGAMRMPLRQFWLYDFLGCFLSIPVWLALGALASVYGKEWLESASQKVGVGFLIGGGVAIIVFIFIIKWRAGKRAKQKTEEEFDPSELSQRLDKTEGDENDSKR